MFPNLTEIKKIRTLNNISQKELASLSGVSQSLITKVESGKIEPTYSKTKKIFEALSKLSNKERITAKEIMNKNIIYISSNDSIESVITLMKKEGISQLPVKDKELIVGTINEKIILNNLVKFKEKIYSKSVKEIMDDCPPIVTINTSRSIILELLKENQLILLSERGEIVGLLSKSDVLDCL